jgi:hypothetical protein
MGLFVVLIVARDLGWWWHTGPRVKVERVVKCLTGSPEVKQDLIIHANPDIHPTTTMEHHNMQHA